MLSCSSILASDYPTATSNNDQVEEVAKGVLGLPNQGHAKEENASPVETTQLSYKPDQFDLISQQDFYKLKNKAATGDVNAEYEIGARYADGEGVELNSVEALKWLQKAAANGDARAQRRVGEMLLDGRGTLTNYDKGLVWLNKAAAQGDALAQFDLGSYYSEGNMEPQNDARAFQYLSAAAERGVSAAQRAVGVMYLRGQGVATNLQAGCEWLKRAAMQNEPEALFNLGALYSNGTGKPKDAKIALGYFVRSATRNDMQAAAYLGIAYVTGDGVPKDFEFGRRLLHAAAKAGNAVGEDNYGKCFWKGEADFDLKTAFSWISKAAAQGLPSAEFEVGYMYEEGIGVSINEVEALKWFYLAARSGDLQARSQRDELVALLRSSDIDEAQERADKFRPEMQHPVPVDDSKVATCFMSPHFYIPVEMFGETKHLLLDTGSSFTSLDDRYQSKLGEALTRDSMKVMFGPEIQATVYRCPDIFVGHEQLQVYWTACYDLAKLGVASGETCDGILGMDFIKNHLISFNWADRTFSIGGSIPVGIRTTARIIPLQELRDQINTFTIDARINGMGTVHLLIDSGNDGAITLSDRDFQQIFRNGNPKSSANHFGDIGGEIKKGEQITLETVMIGSNCYSNLTAEFVPGTYESSIGRKFIRKYVPAIDFPKRVLYLLQTSQD